MKSVAIAALYALQLGHGSTKDVSSQEAVMVSKEGFENRGMQVKENGENNWKDNDKQSGIRRSLRDVEKNSKKRAVNNEFNRKQEITQKLREFLVHPKEEVLSRSEVTKFINQYIQKEGLTHHGNGHAIVLDDKLTDLLQPPAGSEVTFGTLQKFLSSHFIKTDENAPEGVKKARMLIIV